MANQLQHSWLVEGGHSTSTFSMCVQDSELLAVSLILVSLPLFTHSYSVHIHTFRFSFTCFFLPLSPPSGSFLPPKPSTSTYTSPVLQSPASRSLSCDKDGTCSWSLTCYASRSAALIFWHWSPSSCQQQTGTGSWGWVGGFAHK